MNCHNHHNINKIHIIRGNNTNSKTNNNGNINNRNNNIMDNHTIMFNMNTNCNNKHNTPQSMVLTTFDVVSRGCDVAPLCFNCACDVGRGYGDIAGDLEERARDDLTTSYDVKPRPLATLRRDDTAETDNDVAKSSRSRERLDDIVKTTCDIVEEV